MKPDILRAGVVGIGHLGRHHARIYHELEGVELRAVADLNSEAVSQCHEKFGCKTVTHFKDLMDEVDIVSIAVPTTSHYEVAVEFLKAGKHVLVEKPITSTVDQGRELVDLANDNNLILMVGQSERFNPAIASVISHVSDPKFIEVHRLGPFSTRATDVDVVLDLMIHDVDLILNWVNSDVYEIRAMGVPVLSNRIDIANARIQFASGCTANITASRISLKATRKIRIFQRDNYLSIDCLNQEISCFRRRKDIQQPANPMDMIEPVFYKIEKIEPLKSEISSFVHAVRKDHAPPVTGEAGLKALDVCQKISAEIRRNLEKQI
jgi:predicted dehydrogenase